jgi:outer membrane protein assembly factor BamB
VAATTATGIGLKESDMRGWRAPGIALLVAAVAGAALAPIGATARASGAGSWPMLADGPAHNGVNRAESTLTTSNVSGLHVLHTYPAWTEIQADTVYQVIVGNLGYSVTSGTRGGANTYITAFKLPSGSRAWRHQISSHNQTWNYVPAVANGVLFVGGESAMYAFNANTGHQLWTTNVPGIAWFNEVTVTNGVVYADTYQGETVYAFNATTGHVMWSAAPAGCCLTGAVTVSGSLAYVEQSGELFAYNATTGVLAFTAPTDGGGDTVAVSGGVAFVQTANDLQAYNASTGGSLWAAVTESGDVVSSLTPAVDGSTVIVGTTRYLIAFAASTGNRLWTYDTGSDGTEFLPPAIANGVVYAGSGSNGLQAFNEATGAVLYSDNVGFCWSAVVSNGFVYAPCTLGETVWGL